MTDEWGPWIEHDGKGCPVPVGTWGQMVGEIPEGSVYSPGVHEVEGYIDEAGPAWDWSNFGMPSLKNGAVGRVLRYRIRKPRGMTVLQEIVASPELELETA